MRRRTVRHCATDEPAAAIMQCVRVQTGPERPSAGRLPILRRAANLPPMSRIVFFGQAPFGKAVLEGLVERGHDISAVCVPPDRPGAALDPVKEFAVDRGLRVIQRRSYKGEEPAAEVAAEQADLGILAFVTQIIPLAIVDAPRFGSICFHPSLLPAYRGGSAIPWQLIRGEATGGVTLFRPDAGIDTGPIYVQREVEIGTDESAGSFYYKKIFDLGVEATLETAEGVLSGTIEGRVQDEGGATYDPLLRDEHAGIDWARPAAELHDLVRGCDPSPGAHCLLATSEATEPKSVRLYGSRRAALTTAAEPGTVLSLSETGIEIATGEGSLRFVKLKGAGAKVAATEGAAELGVSVGDRLLSAGEAAPV